MKNRKVVVLGGGIAGLSAAFYLAQKGVQVDLVEKRPFLGGIAIGFTCKATDKCQQCGACVVEEMLRNVVQHPNINVFLNTEVEKVKKDNGFLIKLKKGSASLDSSNILRGFSKYNNPLYVVNTKTADSPKEAVKISDLGTDKEIFADAIIVATGFSPFNPILRPTYGYGRWKNVITGLELEQMLRENWQVRRPSDGLKAKRIAFIQCVGSRSKEFNTLWCSEVCCPYALRMASVIKYKDPEIDIWVFFIDVQNVGKDPYFLKDIKTKVKFINAVPIDIVDNSQDQSVKIIYRDKKGHRNTEEFDLAVLSIGITPNEDNQRLSKILGIELDESGFLKAKSLFEPCTTSIEGVFLAGTVIGPKNIIDTISHAKTAVSETFRYLGGSK